ncbi:olfactory receptor 51E1-like [Betta splendens]|uniref:Olfactory receptor n=1 Tax=Betta splendens TaxID=158456 RepID=A0A6P7LD21_BETSP|nr:olfactory receptor 51E1-like [Betta splendens]
MDNSSYFNLSIFLNIGPYRYPAFVLCLLLYVFIVCANLVIIVVILRERALHEAMYVFIALLSANALYGSVGFFPRFLLDILSDAHLIGRPACFAQIYVIYSYAFSEVTILGVMSYDRYVAVCQPLHYHSRMTSRRVKQLAALALIFPSLFVCLSVYMSARLPLCGSTIQKLFCSNWHVVKLACVASALTQIIATVAGLIISSITVFSILYSYYRIVRLCWKSSSGFQTKVFQSCLPHIISIGINCLTALSDSVLNSYNVQDLNPFVAIIVSLEFLIIPPILNPLIYGLKLPEIRTHIVRLFKFKNNI